MKNMKSSTSTFNLIVSQFLLIPAATHFAENVSDIKPGV